VPIASTSQCKNIINLYRGDDIIIILQPLIPRFVNPSHVMASISRATFMSDYSDQLIMSCIKALTMWTVQHFVRNFLFDLLLLLFVDLVDLLLFFGLGGIFHFNIFFASKFLCIFFFSDASFKISSKIKRFFQLICAEFVNI
jgi:hypothetical protein